MNIELIKKRFPSSDGKHKLYCKIYKPDGNPKGLMHVVHGMIEHIGRYDAFMREMAENGYICYGFDNLGHGHTVNSKDELGYIGGWKYMLADVRRFTAEMKKECGNLPCILMGHSMGSFIVRSTVTPKLWDKLIIMGTGGPNCASGAGIAILKLIIKIKGKKSVSPIGERLLFDAYNIKFPENDPHAWFTKIKSVRDKYHADELCSFFFTNDSIKDLVEMQAYCNRRTWFKSKNLILPILIVSGKDDPVGNFGKSVRTVYNRLISEGKNAELHLYKNCRHEILNDTCRKEVISDILNFIE